MQGGRVRPARQALLRDALRRVPAIHGDARQAAREQRQIAETPQDQGSLGEVTDSRTQLTAPEKLRADHDLTEFTCGEASLDDWLRRRALQNEESGASRCYVVCAARKKVVGSYALAVRSIAHEH